MPATLAHTIVALPVAWLTRGRLPLSALAIGCVMPDVEYFLTLTPRSPWGHGLAGSVAWDVPVT